MLVLEKSHKVSVICDLSVISFVEILKDIEVDYQMNKFNRDPRLLKIPNFKVSMGFGLNLGWAIEGAIGSAYKIDASYLSPMVNMASRLEAATKQFNTKFLISEKLVKFCSDSVKKYLRKIDRVTVKGSAEPIELYTFDLDFSLLKPKVVPKIKYYGHEKKRHNYKKRIR